MASTSWVAVLSVLGMGGVVLGVLVWQEGGESVGALIAIGAVSLAALVYWLIRRKRRDELALLDVDLFQSPYFRIGISQQMLQQLALGGAMIVLPIFFQMVLEYNAMKSGLSIAPLSLSMFAIAIVAGKKAGKHRAAEIVRLGFLLLTIGVILLIVVVPRADSGLVFRDSVDHCGIGPWVACLATQQLHPCADSRRAHQ